MIEKSYTIKEVALLLGVKVRTIREWIKTGKIHAIKYGKTKKSAWYILEHEIERIQRGE